MNQKDKITRSHTTTTEATKEIINAAHKLPEITKIAIGIIKPIKSKGGQKTIKFLPIRGGLLAIIRSNGAVQELYLYTKQKTFVKHYLSQIF